LQLDMSWNPFWPVFHPLLTRASPASLGARTRYRPLEKGFSRSRRQPSLGPSSGHRLSVRGLHFPPRGMTQHSLHCTRRFTDTGHKLNEFHGYSYITFLPSPCSEPMPPAPAPQKSTNSGERTGSIPLPPFPVLFVFLTVSPSPLVPKLDAISPCSLEIDRIDRGSTREIQARRCPRRHDRLLV